MVGGSDNGSDNNDVVDSDRRKDLVLKVFPCDWFPTSFVDFAVFFCRLPTSGIGFVVSDRWCVVSQLEFVLALLVLAASAGGLGGNLLCVGSSYASAARRRGLEVSHSSG